jgi:competence protein ComEA
MIFGKGALLATAAALLLAATFTPAVAAAPVDVNTADVKALEALPGVGPATAQAIVAGRPYSTVDDLARVKGIGKGKLEKMRPFVTAGTGAAAKGLPAAPPVPSTVKGLPPSAPPRIPSPAQAGKAARQAVPSGPVNLNTASLAELEALPGIGPKKAQAIIDGRPYQKPEDVMKVKGIKQGIYGKIADRITVR